jgi:hypothetical protein
MIFISTVIGLYLFLIYFHPTIEIGSLLIGIATIIATTKVDDWIEKHRILYLIGLKTRVLQQARNVVRKLNSYTFDYRGEFNNINIECPDFLTVCDEFRSTELMSMSDASRTLQEIEKEWTDAYALLVIGKNNPLTDQKMRCVENALGDTRWLLVDELSIQLGVIPYRKPLLANK